MEETIGNGKLDAQNEDEKLDIENWSEGNEHLKKLLESCRDNQVPSMYCCAGHGDGRPAYITVQMNEKTMGKIYHIMSQLADKKEIGFRFAQKEFGKDTSFTVYMGQEREKDQIMDIISEAMIEEKEKSELPADFQMLTDISGKFMNEEVGFDLEYSIGKNRNKLLMENLRFGNSQYIEKSDFKRMGLKARKDMYGNTQYYRNGMNAEKSKEALEGIFQGVSQIYDGDFEMAEGLSFSQKLLQRMAANRLLRRIPIVSRMLNEPKQLPAGIEKVHSTKEERIAFMDRVSNHGEYRNLPARSRTIDIQKEDDINKGKEQNEQEDRSL